LPNAAKRPLKLWEWVSQPELQWLWATVVVVVACLINWMDSRMEGVVGQAAQAMHAVITSSAPFVCLFVQSVLVPHRNVTAPKVVILTFWATGLICSATAISSAKAAFGAAAFGAEDALQARPTLFLVLDHVRMGSVAVILLVHAYLITAHSMCSWDAFRNVTWGFPVTTASCLLAGLWEPSGAVYLPNSIPLPILFVRMGNFALAGAGAAFYKG
jgi:hypothetical protein